MELEDAQWQLLLKNIVVEVLTLAKNGRDVGEVVYRTHPGKLTIKHPQAVNITVDADGGSATVEFVGDGKLSEDSVLNGIAHSLPLPEDPASTYGQQLAFVKNLRHFAAEETAELTETNKWMHLQLQDPDAKFAVCAASPGVRD